MNKIQNTYYTVITIQDGNGNVLNNPDVNNILYLGFKMIEIKYLFI